MGYHYGDFMRERQYVMISGGFDPIHVGHVRLIQEAARHGHGLYVVLNSDDWLLRKKGYVFMPWEERAEIIQSIAGVSTVVAVDDSDDTVCEAIKKHRPAYFANGGDRKSDNTPEVQVCKDLGIKTLWNIGGNKIQSSSELVAKQKEDTSKTLTETQQLDLFNLQH